MTGASSGIGEGVAPALGARALGMFQAWGTIDILVNNATLQAERPAEADSYGRIGLPEDIGKAAPRLASDDAAYIHGRAIFVDGGMTLYPEFAHGG